MAEEAHYSSGTDTISMKRKYEEQTTPSPIQPQSVGRRASGFSAPITSSSPDSGRAPSSYSSVPPPMDDIQLAKQRAQEIAARLFSTASSLEAKRPRVENGGGFDLSDKGYSSYSSDVIQKPMMSSTSSQIPVSYGYNQGSNKKVDIPNGKVGVIIGKAGETIKYLQLQSGAKIQVTRDSDADPNSMTRTVEIMGTPEAIAKAEQLITDVLSEADTGGPGMNSGRIHGQSGSGEQFSMQIPNNKVGLVIGKGGETIKNMQATTGARIQVIPLHLPPGDPATERSVQINGTSEQIESAKLLVNEVISENRPRNSSMGGGGYSQQGYQTRPSANWAPPPGPPMQQYGYNQPQYQQQQSYGGGYPVQQNSGSSGYDYYNQQPGAPQSQNPSLTDSTGYNYNQQGSGYNQQPQGGYSQDAYGGGYGGPVAPTGYNNQTQVAQGGYDQQAYPGGDSAQTVQPAQPGQPGQQPTPNPVGYGVPPPASQTGYGTQQPVQPGYGSGYGPPPPQTQRGPAAQPGYGQSPTAQGGYGQPAPVQPGYPPQSGGAGGYGPPPPYGGGYGQQAPAYNTYGGGYPQAPAYSGDAPAGGGATTQAAVPKASPPS